jgi:V/A-type H+/Na+-transporting ATPase subunit D
MSRLNVPPTKSSLLVMKRDLAMATEGFNLLEQKREILVLELMRLVDRVRVVQAEVEQHRQRAYETLRKAVARNGYHRMRSIGAGIHYEHKVSTDTRVTAGVRVPTINIEPGAFSSQFGFAGTDSLVDQTMRDFLALLQAVGRLAELESAVWLLARELKKTQRRVNALEQIFIPAFQETVGYIRDVLEGKDLESFFMMKMVKRNNEAKAQAQEVQ